MSPRTARLPHVLPVFLALGLALPGCGTGIEGPPGPPGPPGPTVIDLGTISDADLAALDVQSRITGVDIASPPVVTFTVSTASGTPITGIGDLWAEDNRFVRFTLTKLVPGDNGDPSVWVAYTRDTTNDGSTPPDYDTGSSLFDNGDGTYVFTFNTDVAGVSGVTYEPDLSHRVAGQIGSRAVSLASQNLFLDFVPSGGQLTETRNIVAATSCNECHGRLVEHGRRFITEYCVNCHTPELAQGEGDMKFMIHKLHAAQEFEVLDEGIDYSHVTYPQDVTNCLKCHNGADQATPDGDNWKNVPSIAACGSCHADVDFETGENHAGGPQRDNSACASCHPASGGIAGIEDSHLTENATPNNPGVPSGLANISYEIAEARVDAADALEIDFSIMRDGSPMDILNLPSDLTDPGRYPTFLLGYTAGPQDGIDNPIDYNNLGRTAGQPQSVNLGDLLDGGNVAASGTGGMFTATVPEAFPAGAAMRVVALQGYFNQRVALDPEVGEEDVSRHAVSAVRSVTGDMNRRVITGPTNCSDCHEWLELHGGNRVIGASTDPLEPPVCVLCHNPNLSSSGRTANPAEPLREDTVAAVGDNPLTYPERAQNFRDLVHGIHAAATRSTDYEFVRNRLNGIYYNFSEVTFPGNVNNCLTCHNSGTYELPLADGVLMTTERTTNDADPLTPPEDGDRDDILAARGSVPNDTDLVNTPTSATCYMCHDSTSAVAHMEQNGGSINVLLPGGPADSTILTRAEVRSAGNAEACTVCHGGGRVADLNVVHGIE